MVMSLAAWNRDLWYMIHCRVVFRRRQTVWESSAKGSISVPQIKIDLQQTRGWASWWAGSQPVPPWKQLCLLPSLVVYLALQWGTAGQRWTNKEARRKESRSWARGELGRARLHPSAITTGINPWEGRQSSLTDQLLCNREAWDIFWVLEGRMVPRSMCSLFQTGIHVPN